MSYEVVAQADEPEDRLTVRQLRNALFDLPGDLPVDAGFEGIGAWIVEVRHVPSGRVILMTDR